MKSEAETKTINLRVWMFLKIVPAALLLLYYWMCARTDFHTSYLYVQSAVLAFGSAVPEPVLISVLALGALGAWAAWRRRKNDDDAAQEHDAPSRERAGRQS